MYDISGIRNNEVKKSPKRVAKPEVIRYNNSVLVNVSMLCKSEKEPDL